VRRIIGLIFGFCFCGLLLAARADTFQLTDGTSLTGTIVTVNDNGVMFHLSDDQYSDRIPWTKFTQDSLKEFSKDPKIKPLVEPFIEIPLSERPKKEEIKVRDVSRLELPPNASLFGALFSSSVGLVILLLIYAANIFAGFEIAVVRSRPIPLVMGVTAVLPILGPIIFLSLPEKTEAAPAAVQPAGETATFAVPGQQPAAEEIKIVAGSWQTGAPAAAAAAAQPEAQIFQRGQFTFNRRFFETKFSGFFGSMRRGAEKNLLFLVKTTRENLVVERVTRIAANDVHFEVEQGAARIEVMVPFADIQEIQLKPKPA
jgi:hypothetical protein